MFYVTLPICCGIHIANNYRREPNATLNRITSFAIPLLATTGLGFVAGRYPGNFFEGCSVTFIPFPILRALSALKAICVEHAKVLVTFLEDMPPVAWEVVFGLAWWGYRRVVQDAPHFVAAPVVAACAYLVFGLINVATTYSGAFLGPLIVIIGYHSVLIIAYGVRLIQEYAPNPV